MSIRRYLVVLVYATELFLVSSQSCELHQLPKLLLTGSRHQDLAFSFQLEVLPPGSCRMRNGVRDIDRFPGDFVLSGCDVSQQWHPHPLAMKQHETLKPPLFEFRLHRRCQSVYHRGVGEGEPACRIIFWSATALSLPRDLRF